MPKEVHDAISRTHLEDQDKHSNFASCLERVWNPMNILHWGRAYAVSL